MFLSKTESITGSIYSSTSLNRHGKPNFIASSSCLIKSGSLKVQIYIKIKCKRYTYVRTIYTCSYSSGPAKINHEVDKDSIFATNVEFNEEYVRTYKMQILLL